MLVTVQETTRRVLTERRARLLQHLAARELEADSERDAIAFAVAVLDGHPEDVAFALVYVRGDDANELHLAGAAGLTPGHAASTLALGVSTTGCWSAAAEAMRERTAVRVSPLPPVLGEIRHRLSSEPVRDALVVPLLGAWGARGQRGCWWPA